MTVPFGALVVAPCVATFGESVQCAPASGAQLFMANGIFMEHYREIDPATGMILTDDIPVIEFYANDFLSAGRALPVKGDGVTIISSGEVFFITQVRADRWGRLVCKLNLGV